MKVGEWVKRKYNGQIGWISATRENDGVTVEFPDGTRTSNLYSYNLENYEDILPEVKEDAKKAFIELALMTKDKDWFMEVSG